MKLGKRLQTIESMVGLHYDNIWDCCCDHGLLGAALLSKLASKQASQKKSSQAVPRIHFVDIVPELMYILEDKLARFFPLRSQWQVHCMDVSSLPLQKIPGRHLVIIAGVGGDLMAELVNAIRQNSPVADIDFLLCPVHHQFTLRQQLIQRGFGLETETLVVENQRFYEVLLVSSNNHNGNAINPVGSLLWQADTAEQCQIATKYLDKTLEHYKRMKLQKDNSNAQTIIDAYSEVVITRNR